MSGRIVNKGELSEILDINEQTLSEWQRAGMPMTPGISKRAGNKYDTAAVIAWLVAREVAKSGSESDRDRLARLQGDKIELELSERRHELIPATEIEPAWSGMVVAARQSLLSLPGRIAPMLGQMAHEDAMRELLRDEIEDALRKIGNDESRADGADGPREEALGTATADSAVAMG